MTKLRAYRLKRGISQGEMAHLVGVGTATISRIETGARVPSMGLVSRICEATAGELTANDFMHAPVEQAEAS